MNKSFIRYITIGLSGSALLLIIGFLLLAPGENTPLRQVFPLPTPVPQELQKNTPLSPTPLTLFEKEIVKQELITLLPLQTQTYTIEYLYTSDEFVVTILEGPYEENKQRAEQWFKNHGIKNLAELKINWVTYRWVQ